MNKVLVVGLGSIGKRHVHVFRDLFPKLTIAALRRATCSQEQLNLLNIDYCFTSIDEALSFEPDMAIIASPASMHLDFAFRLVDSGVHLFIEKPISSSTVGVQQLINHCEEKKVKLAVAYNLRFLPSLNAFKDYLRKGQVGTPISIRAEVGQYLPSWRPGSDYQQTVSAKHSLGGGALLELSHEIDYLLWLFGDVEWVKAHISKQSELEIDVEDTAHLLLGFKKIDTDKQLIASLNIDFIRHDFTRLCTVIGDEGTLSWNGVTGEVNYYSQNAIQWKTLFCDKPERNYTYEEELKAFVSCIEENSIPFVKGEDGLAALKVIEAAKISNNTGCQAMV